MSGDILAAKKLVRGQPSRRISIAFRLICRTIDREQLERIICERLASLGGKLLRASLPCITERHHVIDLHLIARLSTAHKLNCFAGVGIDERAAHDFAIARDHFFHVAIQDDITRVTSISRRPPIAELSPSIPGLGRSALDRQRRERVERSLGVGRVRRGGNRYLRGRPVIGRHKPYDRDTREYDDDSYPPYSVPHESIIPYDTPRGSHLARIPNGILEYMQSVTRLFSQFHPRHYDIHWDLTRAHRDRIVTGTVSISGTQTDPHMIRLHSHELDIISVSVNDTQIDTFSCEPADDELRIPHDVPGDVIIAINFRLSLSDAMHGIYPCYFVHDGTKQELYATQFESHHAREAFPCIDEPEAKATFRVSLTHTPHTVALSNMPVASHDGRDHATLTTFDTTPVMSSYLVAFVVGDLQRATTTTKGGVEVNVYATKVHTHSALEFALHHAARTIDFFDDYFGVAYPLPKSDHVALPDFSSGAMENWGLVTYREIALLADPKTISVSGKRYIAEVVAHELSHQWFGNLVTMKWWDNLWLNESFASVMEYLAPAHLYPEWNSWFDFTTNEAVVALRRDCIDGVQPVEVEVHHPDEITSLFDGAIVYAKGGRLLHMMQSWIGETAFRAGLASYFNTHRYANTTGDDLWHALGEASHQDVAALMHAWITQSGYPVVHASLEDGELVLRQEQFFVGPHTSSHKMWPIPLSANMPGLPALLDTAELRIPFTRTDTLYLNSCNTGHFIVHYDDALRHRIISDLKDGRLDDITRAQFLNEQMMLARGGIVSSASLIELLALYSDESNEKVWGMMALALSDLKKFVEHDARAERSLRQFTADLARPQYERLGLDARKDESEDDTKLRATILGCMAYGEDPHVIETLRQRYATTPLDQLEPETRDIVMATAVKYGNDTLVDQLIHDYRTSSSQELQNDIVGAIAATTHPEVFARLLPLLKEESTVRKQDLIRWFVAFLASRYGRSASWRWMRDEWHWIESAFDGDKSYDYFPRYSAGLLNSREQLEEYRAFFTPLRDNPALTRTIDMGLLDLEGRIDLLERDTPAVVAALNNLD